MTVAHPRCQSAASRSPDVGDAVIDADSTLTDQPVPG
jgi:hypothetical protein